MFENTEEIWISDHQFSEPDGEIRVEIESIKIHEKLGNRCSSQQNPIYNIALVKTKTKMDFKLTKDGFGSVNKVCLPSSKGIDHQAGEVFKTMSWGENETLYTTDFLNHYSLTVVDINSCDEAVFEFFRNHHDSLDIATDAHKTANHFTCATDEKGLYRYHMCEYDVGSPLVREINGKWELIGLAHRVCDFFVRIGPHLDWIKANM